MILSVNNAADIELSCLTTGRPKSSWASSVAWWRDRIMCANIATVARKHTQKQGISSFSFAISVKYEFAIEQNCLTNLTEFTCRVSCFPRRTAPPTEMWVVRRVFNMIFKLKYIHVVMRRYSTMEPDPPKTAYRVILSRMNFPRKSNKCECIRQALHYNNNIQIRWMLNWFSFWWV